MMFDDIRRFHFARNLHNPASLQIAWDRAKNMTLQQIVYSRANLLTVKQSWNHMRGLSDRGKAALTVPRLFTARRTVCGEITVDVAPACVAEFDGITPSPLSYLTHLAIYIRPHLASKLIALDCREAPMSKQPNCHRAKKMQNAA